MVTHVSYFPPIETIIARYDPEIGHMNGYDILTVKEDQYFETTNSEYRYSAGCRISTKFDGPYNEESEAFIKGKWLG